MKKPCIYDLEINFLHLAQGVVVFFASFSLFLYLSGGIAETGLIKNIFLAALPGSGDEGSGDTAPTLTGILASPDPIKGGNQITITPSGQGDAELDTLYFYCNETGSPASGDTSCSEANVSYSSPYSSMVCTYNVALGDTTRTVYCRAYDGTSYSSEQTDTYLVDSTAPSTAASAGAYVFGEQTTGAVSVSLSCSDGAGSGCQSTFYCTDSSGSCTPSTTYSAAVVFSSIGTSYMRYYSTDVVTNAETVKSKTIVISSGGGGSPPPPSHSECSKDEKCVSVDGAGKNLCNSAADCQCSKKGDINKDTKINLSDFSIELFYFGQTTPKNKCADINKDGKVDLHDLSIMFYWWTW